MYENGTYLVVNHLLCPVIFLERREKLDDIGILCMGACLEYERRMVCGHTSASKESPVPSKQRTRVRAP
jgi:hypothetical protein